MIMLTKHRFVLSEASLRPVEDDRHRIQSSCGETRPYRTDNSGRGRTGAWRGAARATADIDIANVGDFDFAGATSNPNQWSHTVK